MGYLSPLPRKLVNRCSWRDWHVQRASTKCRMYAFSVCLCANNSQICLSFPYILLVLEFHIFFLIFWRISNYLLKSSTVIPTCPKLSLCYFPQDDIRGLFPSPLSALRALSFSYASLSGNSITTRQLDVSSYSRIPIFFQLLTYLLYLPATHSFFPNFSPFSLPEFS